MYLITGGLGGVGLVLAEYLAREFKARLVLTGRRGLPPRAQWADHVAARGSAGRHVSGRIRAVEALEAAGAEVLVGAADVSTKSAMRAVVDEACARFGRIDGVIHAAGVAGGGMIQLKTPEIADAVLAPKVTGTQVLERVLAGRQLDFLMLCSSLTGVLGGVGQVDYCGANAYLDAFAAHYTATTGNVHDCRELERLAGSRHGGRHRCAGGAQGHVEGRDARERHHQRAKAWTRSGGSSRMRPSAQVALSPFDVQLAIDAEGLPAERR